MWLLVAVVAFFILAGVIGALALKVDAKDRADGRKFHGDR